MRAFKSKSRFGLTSVAACAALTATSLTAGAAQATNPVPADRGDVVPARTLTVTTLADSGPGSLRTMIATSNRLAPGSTIKFAVTGTIQLASELPNITRTVLINGATSPRFKGTAPAVGIDFRGHAGLRFEVGSGGTGLNGHAITNARRDGVTLVASRIRLNQNYIGLNINGVKWGNRAAGIYITPLSRGNQIGANLTVQTRSSVRNGVAGVFANVISGNGGSGIMILGSSGNTIVSNRIGTNAAGTAAIGNLVGITLDQGASRNTIGGTAVGTSGGKPNNPTGSTGKVAEVYAAPPLGNIISGNRLDGVLANRSSLNVLNGNFIGTDAAGLARVANGRNGVWFLNSPNNALRGCGVTTNPFIYYNVVSGNVAHGLRITNSNNTVVQANFFGIGMNNTTIVRNGGNGILVDGNSAGVQAGGVIPLGNVAAGNRLNGTEVRDQDSGFTTFNTFGGLLAFKGSAPNGENGLLITATGGNNLVRTNVMSGNAKNGIMLAGNARGVTIDPNVVGLQTTGSYTGTRPGTTFYPVAPSVAPANGTLGNGHHGLFIAGNAHDNVIGGTRVSVIPQNTFSGNTGFGIAIAGTAYNNRIIHTFVGTTIPGFEQSGKDQGNGFGGIFITGRAHNNTVGQLGTGKPSTVISNNGGVGVVMTGLTRHNNVLGSYIGYSRTGAPWFNARGGILNLGPTNRIIGNSVQP